MSMSGKLLAYTVLILYILINVEALTCVESMGSDHHHAAGMLDHSSHSLLCALACQANIGATPSVPLLGLFSVGGRLAVADFTLCCLPSHSRNWRFVRGPPLFVHSL